MLPFHVTNTIATSAVFSALLLFALAATVRIALSAAQGGLVRAFPVNAVADIGMFLAVISFVAHEPALIGIALGFALLARRYGTATAPGLPEPLERLLGCVACAVLGALALHYVVAPVLNP